MDKQIYRVGFKKKVYFVTHDAYAVHRNSSRHVLNGRSRTGVLSSCVHLSRYIYINVGLKRFGASTGRDSLTVIRKVVPVWDSFFAGTSK
jgi:hypothetical protein